MYKSVRGFTVVELLITLIIMVTLLSLGVVGVRGTLVNARDAERQADIESIARGLESYYNRGNPKQFTYQTKGTYPGAHEMNFMMGVCGSIGTASTYLPSVCSADYLHDALAGTSPATVFPPQSTTRKLYTSVNSTERTPAEIVNDSIATNLSNGFYVYKPLGRTGFNVCNSQCARYALIYRKESTSQNIIVMSRRR